MEETERKNPSRWRRGEGNGARKMEGGRGIGALAVKTLLWDLEKKERVKGIRIATVPRRRFQRRTRNSNAMQRPLFPPSPPPSLHCLPAVVACASASAPTDLQLGEPNSRQ